MSVAHFRSRGMAHDRFRVSEWMRAHVASVMLTRVIEVGFVVLLHLRRKHDCPIDGHWQSAVSSTQHHHTDDEFGEGMHGTSEGIVSLRRVRNSLDRCKHFTHIRHTQTEANCPVR